MSDSPNRMTEPKPVPRAASRGESGDARFAGKVIHFIGIGGCGMSGLARMLRSRGAVCSGTDAVPSELTESLLLDGIAFSSVQDGSAIPDACEMVIASAAIRPDHPELMAANERGVAVFTYAEALGMVQHDRTAICIAGTHGKSTTAAMLAHVLIRAEIDPSFIIGATCPQIGGGSRTGANLLPRNQSEYSVGPGVLICEACEFNRSFHHHRPTIALINNVEEDHLDIYGSLDAIVEAFGQFAHLVPAAAEGGRLLIAHEGAHRREVTSGLTCGIATFGYHPEAEYQVIYDPAAQRVGVLRDGHWLAQWTNQMQGAHNALNAAAAGILASWLGVAWERIAEALGDFQGVDRRMQKLGVRRLGGSTGGTGVSPVGEVVVYDDYGHHPTEIEKTLKALQDAEKPKRLVCVFQPHQHSRTRFLLDEFEQSFSHADLVIVPHIYFVRDSEIEKSRVNATDLVDRLRRRGVQAMHVYPFEAIVDQLELLLRDGDLLVVMGAGPVWKVAREYLDRANAGYARSHAST